MEIRHRMGKSLKKRIMQNSEQKEVYKKMLNGLRVLNGEIPFQCKNVLKEIKVKLDSGLILSEEEIS